jgi:sugar (pentulose or hexulose) kinase
MPRNTVRRWRHDPRMTELFLGIDLGTSGIRCAVVDANRRLIAMTRAGYPDDTARGWWDAVTDGLHQMRREIGDAAMARIKAAAVDGTSGTMVLVDARLDPVTPPLMYNSGGFEREALAIAPHAPAGDITLGPASGLARLLHLQGMAGAQTATHMCHQADFILAKLRGRAGASDENNSLKTGYDPARRCWPDWLVGTGLRRDLLPQVHPVGTALGPVAPQVASAFGLNKALVLRAGTTDSIAAFLATGAAQGGEAVTSLGTTLAIKLLSDRRIEDASRGVYSHRLGDRWLVGGASNTGGGALLAHFTLDRIMDLAVQINPAQPFGPRYYPLVGTGERFPVNDPARQSVVSPRPADDAAFLHGLLEGIAHIEADCYRVLEDLGAPVPSVIWTAGGGGASEVWTAIRRRVVSASIRRAPQTEAAIGAAFVCLDP